MDPKDIIPDEEDDGDIDWLDDMLLEVYTRIKNRRGARNLLKQRVDAFDHVLNDIEHLKMDLSDFETPKAG